MLNFNMYLHFPIIFILGLSYHNGKLITDFSSVFFSIDIIKFEE